MNFDKIADALVKENVALHGYKPTKPKRIQDILALWGFLIILGGISYIGIRAFQVGDIGRYIHSTDSWGNVCGRKENIPYSNILNSEKNLIDEYFGLTITFNNNNELADQYSICINKCPATSIDCGLLLNESGYIFNDTYLNQVLCKNNLTILPHVPFGNQCIHLSNFQVNSSAYSGILSFGTVNAVIQFLLRPLTLYWRDMIYLGIITFCLILFVILLLQLFTRLLLILLILLGVFLSLAASTYMWYNYAISIGAADEQTIILSVNKLFPFFNATDALNLVTFPTLRNSSNLLLFSITASLISLILIITIVLLSKSICFTIRLFDESCQVVYKSPALLLQSLATMLFVGAISTYGILVFALLFSSMESAYCTNEMVLFQFEITWQNIGMLCMHIFGTMYMIEYVMACYQIILADAVASCFFKERSFVVCPTCKSIGYLITFNLGSAALGTLIILILHIVKAFFYIIHLFLNRCSDTEESILAACLTFGHRLLMQMSTISYIGVGIFGDSFFSGGKRSFSLISKNRMKMISLFLIKHVCFYAIKLPILCSMMLISLLWFMASVKFNSDVLLFIIPISVTSVLAFIISTFLFKTYDVAMDTIFLCFCFDEQVNNGTTRPYYSSQKLQTYMSRKKKIEQPPKCESFTSINWDILTGEPHSNF